MRGFRKLICNRIKKMIRKKNGGVDYFQFPNLAEFPTINHGVFTRKGGVSEGCFKSLNIGFNTQDKDENVLRNREIVLKIMGGKTLVSVNQVHGIKVAQYRQEHHGSLPPVEADAIVTNRKGAALLIQTADCQAVLLYDPLQNVIGNIHSGWKGSVGNIIAETIRTMEESYGSRPSDILAGIGPSLGLCCGEFIHYKRELPESFWDYQNESTHFDFPNISLDQLCCAGVLKKNIHQSKLCTKCNEDLFFSYRRDKVTGRLANVIQLV